MSSFDQNINTLSRLGFEIDVKEFTVGRKKEEFIRFYITENKIAGSYVPEDKRGFSIDAYSKVHRVIEDICDDFIKEERSALDHITYQFVKMYEISDLSYSTVVIPSKEELKGFIIEHIEKTKSPPNTKTRPSESFWKCDFIKRIDILFKRKKKRENSSADMKTYGEYIGSI